MKKIIFLVILFVTLININVSAFPELEDARWAKNYESSVTIKNTETASFFYTISSSNAPLTVSIYVTDIRNIPLSHVLTQTITEEDFEKQGYIYSNGELKLGYTSDLIVINPNDYGLEEGNYNIQIEIKDEKNNERNSILALDLVVVKETSNKAPTAVIEVSPSKTVKIGIPITLSGLGSYDEDGSIAEYDWAQFSGYEAFQFDEKASAIIVTPAKEGFFSFVLKVKDNEGLESSLVLEEVKVVKEDISETNQAPIARAGQDLVVGAGSTVKLDGSSSYDPDGDMIAHLWKQINGENVVLSGITTATPSFLASEVGEYQFELTVTDSKGAISSDEVLVQVLKEENVPPVALFNMPSESKVGELVTFNASDSYDPDSSIVEYKWETDGKTFFGKVANYVFTVAKEFIVKLTVTDNKGATSTLEKVINVKDSQHEENRVPVSNAGLDQSVKINNIVTLDGSLSYDPDGDKLSYSWTQMEGSLVGLEDSATKNPRFTPNLPGIYKFSLTVIDDKGASSLPDEVVIVIWEDGQIIPPEEEISRNIHKFTIASAFVKENGDRLDIYTKVRNRGNNREDVILSATILPTGEYASTRTITEIKENSYEVLSLNKPQEEGNYIIKIDVSNRKNKDVYYLPLEV